MSEESWWKEAHAIESLFFQKFPTWRQFVTRRAVREKSGYLLFEAEIYAPPPGTIMMILALEHCEQDHDDPEQLLATMAIYSKTGKYLSSNQYAFDGEQSLFWQVIERVLNEQYIFLVKFIEGEARYSRMFSPYDLPDSSLGTGIDTDAVIVRSWLGKFDLGAIK